MGVVVRAAQPALIAELEEGDDPHGADFLFDEGEFVRGLAHGERPGEGSTGTGLLLAVPAAARLALVEVGPRVVCAEVQFADFARLQFRDVEQGLLVALLALHGILLPDLLES